MIDRLNTMTAFRRLSIVEQTLEYFREGLRAGRWKGSLPGARRFEKELDVSKATVLKAFALLEEEGWLLPSGDRRRREIAAKPPAQRRSAKRRIVIITEGALENMSAEYLMMILRIRNRLIERGHECEFATETFVSMKGDFSRVEKLVAATPADIWLLQGASEEVLTRFATLPVPAMAVGGRPPETGFASVYVDTSDALRAVIRKMIAEGHTRIVFVYPPGWRVSRKGYSPGIFFEELAAAGIPAGDYNLPDWEYTPEGYIALLRGLFSVTPPTALILTNSTYTLPTLHFLAQRGLSVPKDVSLAAMTDDVAQASCRPEVSCLYGPMDDIARHVVRWVDGVAKGRVSRTRVGYPAKFKVGGTIGPVRRGK